MNFGSKFPNPRSYSIGNRLTEAVGLMELPGCWRPLRRHSLRADVLRVLRRA